MKLITFVWDCGNLRGSNPSFDFSSFSVQLHDKFPSSLRLRSLLPSPFFLSFTTVHFPIDINYFTDRAKFNVASTLVSTSENTNSNTSLVDKFKYVLLKKIRWFLRFRKKMFLYPVKKKFIETLHKLTTNNN